MVFRSSRTPERLGVEAFDEDVGSAHDSIGSGVVAMADVVKEERNWSACRWVGLTNAKGKLCRVKSEAITFYGEPVLTAVEKKTRKARAARKARAESSPVIGRQENPEASRRKTDTSSSCGMRSAE